MGTKTGIQWTDHTFNPWWGCHKVSAGCKHCYAMEIARRFHPDKPLWGAQHDILPASDATWALPVKWNAAAHKAGVQRRVFCASMADVFEGLPSQQAAVDRLFALIDATPNLAWQLLTKRPENIPHRQWPRNVWLMTSVENQTHTGRIDHVLRHNVPVRGLSCEPLLGPLDLTPWLPRLQWVIAGGESGRGARFCNPSWVRSLRDQCAAHGVAFFFKQWGAQEAGNQLDGERYEAFPII